MKDRFRMPEIKKDEELAEIIKKVKKVAVVGISKDEGKPSYYVSKALVERGFKLFGVNPKYEGQEILGMKVYSSLLDIPEELEAVLVFRPPNEVPKIAEEAKKKGFSVFWMQPGTTNLGVKEELINLGYTVVSERCMKEVSERFLPKTT